MKNNSFLAIVWPCYEFIKHTRTCLPPKRAPKVAMVLFERCHLFIIENVVYECLICRGTVQTKNQIQFHCVNSIQTIKMSVAFCVR